MPDCSDIPLDSLGWIGYVNDPSAGSPTETLLRLLLPLSDKICLIYRGYPLVQKAHRTTRNR